MITLIPLLRKPRVQVVKLPEGTSNTSWTELEMVQINAPFMSLTVEEQ